LKAKRITHNYAETLFINQEDADERIAQVGKLDAIYQRASEVAAWLGSEQRIMERTFHTYLSVNKERGVSILPIFNELLSQPY
jgi:hypothetical protein